MLNEQGSVIGISTAGMNPGGSQVGLNFFIPVMQALAFIKINIE
jgi:S1-C subfamily serine protease